MVKINENYLKLEKNYLFIRIAEKVNAFQKANPDAKLIRMGIGDVTRPIAPVVVNAMKKACDEMGVKETFRGYEDSGAGYDFLRNAVSDYYRSFGADVPASDIRINDGAKSDCGNLVDIFGDDNIILITDPAYPVYVDSNLMNGRQIVYADSNEENQFAAMPAPDGYELNGQKVFPDIIYLCSPNNPTGAAYSKEQLAEWIAYAKQHGAVILYDAAYEAFISEDNIPRSIYQIDGAKEVAIEMCSLSKTAGFTGVRCGYTVVPSELKTMASDGTEVSLAQLWNRREGSKFNGVSYPVQRGAEAVFTPEGQKQVKENIIYYQENARVIAETLKELNIPFTGGINSPYIWFKCPFGMDSWTFFDKMLNEIAVVGTPGAGFGKNGTNWFRLTAFGDKDLTIEAMNRLKELVKNSQ
ncbi:MAG: LL-diaminopimelate aminotransferase [Oscillospiraceae bacterium]|nr:LL-diaminopimelate aminotransferase [Oscillospiraceae bacterium]